MDRLHGGDNSQFGQSPGILRMQKLHVLDTMAQRRQAPLTLKHTHLGQPLECFMVRPIPNCMDGQAQPSRGSSPTDLRQLLPIQVENAVILGFLEIRLKHGRSARTERAVHKNLHRPNAQKIVPKPTA
jgi:hypothetical protein